MSYEEEKEFLKRDIHNNESLMKSNLVRISEQEREIVLWKTMISKHTHDEIKEMEKKHNLFENQHIKSESKIHEQQNKEIAELKNELELVQADNQRLDTHAYFMKNIQKVLRKIFEILHFSDRPYEELKERNRELLDMLDAKHLKSTESKKEGKERINKYYRDLIISDFLEKILAFNYALPVEPQIIEIREWLEEMLK